MTNEERIQKIKALSAELDELKSGLKHDDEPSQDISPHTNLPVAHPESQAVERERYLAGLSLAGAEEQPPAEPEPNSELPTESPLRLTKSFGVEPDDEGKKQKP